MPRLHKYVNRDAHYVLTRIDGSIITYQLARNHRLVAANAALADVDLGRVLLTPSSCSYRCNPRRWAAAR